MTSRAEQYHRRLAEARSSEVAARNAIPSPCRIDGLGEVARVSERGAYVEFDDKVTEIRTPKDALLLAHWLIAVFGEPRDHGAGVVEAAP